MSRIEILVAVASNGVIGRQGDLPWRLSADLKHFKATTMGHPIVMGRLTWESIGRVLPGRTNIVVTSQADYEAPGCVVVNSLEAAAGIAKDEQCLMVIGGARLYEQALPLAERIHLTEVHAEVEGDVYFPELDRSAWREVSREAHQRDENNDYDYSFVVLERAGTA